MSGLRFSFFRKNYVFTSSSMSATSGNGSLVNLIDRNPAKVWTTASQNSDVLTAVVQWTPDSATNISYVMLLNHNFKDFRILYNSGTTFTPNFSVTSNTFSNTLFAFGSVTVNNLQIMVTKTMVTNSEKTLGELIVTNLKTSLDANPLATNYRPIRFKKGLEQELSDGGIVSVFLAQKFRADINMHFISTDTADSLVSIWSEHTDMVFVPFGVNTFTTAWAGQAEFVNWIGDLDISRPRDNVVTGYQGIIRLAQIPD